MWMPSAPLPLAVPYARRALGFVSRHRWSVPLSLSSTISLLYLAAEMRDGDLDGVDAVLAGVVHGWRGSMDGVMLACTQLGGGSGMAVVSLAVVAALLIRQRRRTALFMAIAALGTLALSTGLKLLFHRARPDIQYLIQAPSSFSFPSGHAMGSMGVLASTVVVLYAVGAPRPLRLAATVLIGLFVFGVALSRVYFGVHYPSDVVGGQLAAAAWVSALTGWFYPRLFPGEETLEPAPNP
jgi:membrane-associated phospholipid phosphatase